MNDQENYVKILHDLINQLFSIIVGNFNNRYEALNNELNKYSLNDSTSNKDVVRIVHCFKYFMNELSKTRYAKNDMRQLDDYIVGEKWREIIFYAVPIFGDVYKINEMDYDDSVVGSDVATIDNFIQTMLTNYDNIQDNPALINLDIFATIEKPILFNLIFYDIGHRNEEALGNLLQYVRNANENILENIKNNINDSTTRDLFEYMVLTFSKKSNKSSYCTLQ